MKETISLSVAKKLQSLIEQTTLAKSKATGPVFKNLKGEQIIYDDRGRVVLADQEGLENYLRREGITDLEEYIEMLEKGDDITRAELVQVTGNSKKKKTKVFKGFLVNCYKPIKATFKGRPLIINPVEGVFNFIYDYDTLIPDPSVTIVGVENAENFRYLKEQNYLFSDIKPLFVCRYPQNQNKHLINWLISISNPYLHFGDFDPAGIGIYLNEYKAHLKNKANFFVPPNIEQAIKEGQEELYYNQKVTFDPDNLPEENLKKLWNLIEQERKVLEQEFFIKFNDK